MEIQDESVSKSLLFVYGAYTDFMTDNTWKLVVT